MDLPGGSRFLCCRRCNHFRPVHGGSTPRYDGPRWHRVEPARDEAGPKEPGQGKRVREVAVHFVSRPLLPGGQGLHQAAAVLAREMFEGIEIDACVGNGVRERRGSEPAESARRPWGRTSSRGSERWHEARCSESVARERGRPRRRTGSGGPGSSRSCRRRRRSAIRDRPWARFSSIAVMASTVRSGVVNRRRQGRRARGLRITSQADHHDQRERPTRPCLRLRDGCTRLLLHFRGSVKVREDSRAYPRQNLGAEVLAQATSPSTRFRCWSAWADLRSGTSWAIASKNARAST